MEISRKWKISPPQPHPKHKQIKHQGHRCLPLVITHYYSVCNQESMYWEVTMWLCTCWMHTNPSSVSGPTLDANSCDTTRVELSRLCLSVPSRIEVLEVVLRQGLGSLTSNPTPAELLLSLVAVIGDVIFQAFVLVLASPNWKIKQGSYFNLLRFISIEFVLKIFLG